MILRFDMFPRAIRAVFRTLWFRLRGFSIIVSGEEQFLRAAECEYCVFREGEQCEKCGCFIEAKTWLAAEECPYGWWGPVKRKRS